ncbi:MAG TPA: hypothetical protein VFS39_03440 [Nitrospira sp.]|nr:hypothetical protein [Nitrospira sp.]
MRPVIQEERTGCGIAAVAGVAGVSYAKVRRVAATVGIHAYDPALWSDTKPVRRLLALFGVKAAAATRPFRSWESLPPAALLAIKWRRRNGKSCWHWVVFVRGNGGGCVLDSKRSLKRHRRTDFGRMKPKWFLSLSLPDRRDDGRLSARRRLS